MIGIFSRRQQKNFSGYFQKLLCFLPQKYYFFCNRKTNFVFIHVFSKYPKIAFFLLLLNNFFENSQTPFFFVWHVYALIHAYQNFKSFIFEKVCRNLKIFPISFVYGIQLKRTYDLPQFDQEKFNSPLTRILLRVYCA